MTAGPAAPTTILYASLDQPNEKLIALSVRRRGAAARRRQAPRPARALSLLHAPGHGVPRGRSDQPESHRRAARRMRRSRDHRRRASASDAGYQSRISGNRVRQSLGNAGDCGRAAQDGLSIQQPSSSGRTRNRSPGSAISPAGSGFPSTVATQDPPRRPLRRNRISGARAHCRPPCPDRGRYRLLRRHHDRLRQGAGGRRRDHDRCRRHPRAVPGRTRAAR